MYDIATSYCLKALLQFPQLSSYKKIVQDGYTDVGKSQDGKYNPHWVTQLINEL